MAIDLNATKSYDPSEAELQPLLRNLQGHILRGHDRANTLNLFLRFTAGPDAVRAALKPLLDMLVMSAAEQEQPGAKDAVAGNFFLSVGGYRKLGFSDAQIKTLLPEKPGGFNLQSNFFDGMKQHTSERADRASKDWQKEYRDEIDALLLLAHDDKARLDECRASVKDKLGAVAQFPVEEWGLVYRKDNVRFEHFGFADGGSQPLFFKDQLEAAGTTKFWSPLAPLSVVLFEDRAAGTENAYGSFYVFRKLEQNVRGFRLREKSLAEELGFTGTDKELVGAMAVGRFRDGTPLALSSQPGMGAGVNDFNYNDSSDRCPFHAHIRKVNPRGDLAHRIGHSTETAELPHRLVRRGIPYGQRAANPWEEQSLDQLPEDGVGLLFACFQASIANQFALVQASWVNRADFLPDSRAGIDPVIGSSDAGTINQWNTQWGGGKKPKPATFGKFVTFLGGEFLFAPSMPFLRLLAPPA